MDRTLIRDLLDVGQFAAEYRENYWLLERTVADLKKKAAHSRGLLGWRLDRIFITHHHADHTGGNLELKGEFSCEITGPAGEAGKIPGIYCRDAQRALDMAKRGFRFMTVGSDFSLVREGSAAALRMLPLKASGTRDAF